MYVSIVVSTPGPKIPSNAHANSETFQQSYKVTYDALFSINTAVTQPSFPGTWTLLSSQCQFQKTRNTGDYLWLI